MRTRITARFVVGFEGRDHVIYREGEVVYEGDTILFVGHDYGGPVDRTIEAGPALVAPGFVDLNALGDIDHLLLDYAVAPDLARGRMWSEDYARGGPREAMTPEEEAFKARYAFVQLITNGITTALPVTSLVYKDWAETRREYERAAEIAAGLGLRTYLGPTYRSAVHVVKRDGSLDLYWDEARGERGLEEAIAFCRNLEGAPGGLVRGLLVPSTVETCTPELLQRTRSASDELGVPIRLHAGQSLREFRLIRERFGMTPVGYLHRLGFLGPRTFLAHAAYVTGHSQTSVPGEGDQDALAETGTVVIHCPLITSHHGTVLESFDRYRRKGIRLALGTDTYPCDMIANLGYGAAMCRAVERTREAGSPAEFYRAATLGGAEALGRPDLGRLAPGAQADLIIIRMDGWRMGQVDDPIKTLVLNGSGADVDTVIIAGRTVMEGRRIPGVDFAELSAQAQVYFDKMKQAYTERDYMRRPSETLFPSIFPMVARR